MRHFLIRVLLLFSLFSASRSAAAQDPAATPHGFIASRYDTHTSSNIFVGYSLGPVDAMVALVQNPRSTYRESILGLAHFGTPGRHFAFTWAVSAAHVTDTDRSWYSQLYLLPDLAYGVFDASGTFELYVPLDSKGVGQFALNPGNVLVKIAPRWKVGAVTVVSTQSNAPYSLGAGPSLQFKIPRGSITLDIVANVTRWDTEERVSFFTSY
ncbi:MAG: hypothetical protein WBC97_07315 [Gemmatimonadales bacterium]